MALANDVPEPSRPLCCASILRRGVSITETVPSTVGGDEGSDSVVAHGYPVSSSTRCDGGEDLVCCRVDHRDIVAGFSRVPAFVVVDLAAVELGEQGNRSMARRDAGVRLPRCR